jgi:hypothetical protein
MGHGFTLYILVMQRAFKRGLARKNRRGMFSRPWMLHMLPDLYRDFARD